jgi:hypothetical protein
MSEPMSNYEKFANPVLGVPFTVPQAVNWSGHSAPSILADLRALCESIRNPTPRPRRIMVRTARGFLQVIPAGDGVHTIQYGLWIGKFRFYEWSRQPHSRVLRHWYDERCER